MSSAAAWRAAAPVLCAFALGAACHDVEEQSASFGRLGPVHLYRETAQPSHMAILLSGSEGWDARAAELARSLASSDTLVVGVDTARVERELASSREPCAYPAGDLEALSQSVQRRLALTRYEHPILVGFGSGATLAYAALAQAPARTFLGAISLGFCAELPLERPWCRGSGLSFVHQPGGVRFEPSSTLESPWVLLQGAHDSSCPEHSAAAFAKQTAGAAVVLVPGADAGAASTQRWDAALRDALLQMAENTEDPTRAPRERSLADLPLVEVPLTTGSSDRLAVIVSGDGGWAGMDRAVGAALAAHGIPVVGLDSLQYFWTRRTPEEAARALERMLDHYLAAWARREAILIGYSRGADVLPFMVSRLPERLRARVRLVALLAPGQTVEFEFHALDWIREPSDPNALPTAPEVAKLRGLPLLCLYGSEEGDSLCPVLPGGAARVVMFPGGHHLGGDYGRIAERILESSPP